MTTKPRASIEERAVLYMIEELILTPRFQVITSLCYVLDENAIDEKAYPPDELSTLLVSIFSGKDKMQDLLTVLISHELEKTIDESTLFRRNCMATKQLSTYARKVGAQYILRLLQPVLLHTSSLDINDYEVDQSKLKNNSANVEENVQNLIELSADIFQKILDSDNYFPTPLRRVCKELHKQVKGKFPNAEYSSVGGFVFLRFICPVLVSPEQFGIVPGGFCTPNMRRILVLVSKILQNISNNVTTNSKEPYMQKMNTFVLESVPKVQVFFAKLVNEDMKEMFVGNSKEFTSKDIGEQKRDTELQRIVAYLKFHVHKIGVVLTSGQAGTAAKPARLQKSELTGYLFKYNENVFGRVTEDWQKRWFILRKGQLLYFKNIQDSHATGIIPLSDAKVRITNADENLFEIELSYRVFTLKSTTSNEMNEWVLRIKDFSNHYPKKVINKANISQSPSAPLQRSESSHTSSDSREDRKWVKPTFQKNQSVIENRFSDRKRLLGSQEEVIEEIPFKSLEDTSIKSSLEIERSNETGVNDPQAPIMKSRPLSTSMGRGQMKARNPQPNINLNSGNNLGDSPNVNRNPNIPKPNSNPNLNINAPRQNPNFSQVKPNSSPDLSNTQSNNSPNINRNPNSNVNPNNPNPGSPVNANRPQNANPNGPNSPLNPNLNPNPNRNPNQRPNIPNMLGNRNPNPNMNPNNAGNPQNQPSSNGPNNRGLNPRSPNPNPNPNNGNPNPNNNNNHNGNSNPNQNPNQQRFNPNMKRGSNPNPNPNSSPPNANNANANTDQQDSNAIEKNMIGRKNLFSSEGAIHRRPSPEGPNSGERVKSCNNSVVQRGLSPNSGGRQMSGAWSNPAPQSSDNLSLESDPNSSPPKTRAVSMSPNAGKEVSFAFENSKLSSSGSLVKTKPSLQSMSALSMSSITEYKTSQVPTQARRAPPSRLNKSTNEDQGNNDNDKAKLSERDPSNILVSGMVQTTNGDRSFKCLLEVTERTIFMLDLGSSCTSNNNFPIRDCEIKNLPPNKFQVAYNNDIFVFQPNNFDPWKNWLEKLEIEMKLSSISSLSNANSVQSTTGYLMKLEKDKKSWSRYWAALQDRTLLFYKNEKAKEPISKYVLQNLVLRFNETDTQNFVFDIVLADITITLESSNQINLTKWIRAFNSARKRKSLSFNDNISKTGYLMYCDKKVSTEPVKYWSELSGIKLRFYEDDTETKLSKEISLEFCVIHPSVSEDEFEISAITNDIAQSFTLKAESKEVISSWVSLMKKGKLRYWQSDIDRLPDITSRGYLMKAGRNKNKWGRRWFVLTENFLLYFKTTKDSTPLGEIKLVSSTIRNTESNDTPLRFEIQCENRSYYLEANDSIELKMWINSIKQAKLNCTRSQGAEVVQRHEVDDALRNPEWEGYLMKKGVTYQAWKRRWFVLKYPNFYYFHSSQVSPGEHAGVIPLSDMNIVEASNQSSKDIQFQIVTRSRVYFIKADNIEVMNKCISSINNAKAKALVQSTHLSNSNPTSPIASPRVYDANLEKSGFLVKKGRTNKVWKKRWFVLSDNLLSYYKSNQDTEPAGMVPLENSTTSIADDSLKKKFCFVVSTRYRNYFLQATDQYEMAGWIESINFHSEKKVAVDKKVSENYFIFNKLNELLAAHDRYTS